MIHASTEKRDANLLEIKKLQWVYLNDKGILYQVLNFDSVPYLTRKGSI